MQERKRQSGMSIPGILIIMVMAGFFVMCAVKLAPHYFEYLTIKDILSEVSEEHKPGQTSVRQVHRRIDALFNTNQVKAIKNTDVQVYRKEGETIIDGNYEARVPIVGRIDAVIRFDDLVYVAGQPGNQ